jgi:hypothetical protein
MTVVDEFYKNKSFPTWNGIAENPQPNAASGFSGPRAE